MAGLVGVAVAVSACGGAEGPPFTVGDSAGVAVVENSRPEWGGSGWTVGTEPLLRIGAGGEDPAIRFSRVVGAVLLDNGGVAVADAGSQDVQFFRPDGSRAVTVGGTGAGAGEFTGLSALGRLPDGPLWAYDFPLRRITWLTPDGAVDTLVTVGSEPATLSAVDGLRDRSFILKELRAATPRAEVHTPGLRRDSIAFVRVGGRLEPGSPDTLVMTPGPEVHVGATMDGVMSAPPFARNAVGAVAGDRVVVGSQSTFELRVYDRRGAVERIIRLPTPDLTVGPADREEYLDRYVEAVEPERRAALRRILEDVPMPPTRPAYGALLVDRGSHLWVGEWTVFPASPRRWTVIAPDGRWLGTVTVPEGFRPWDIASDRMVGVEGDPMDGERVVVYPLRRLEGAS